MLVDSHCHLDFPDFENELDDVVARASDAGIKYMVTICTKVKEFDRIHSVAERYENIYCSVGTHPNNANQETDVNYEEIYEKSTLSKVVAIGEACLLYTSPSPRDRQKSRMPSSA